MQEDRQGRQFPLERENPVKQVVHIPGFVVEQTSHPGLQTTGITEPELVVNAFWEVELLNSEQISAPLGQLLQLLEEQAKHSPSFK